MPHTDEELKKSIVEHLSWDNRIDASRVAVKVQNAKAALSGTVPNYSSKEIARTDALSVSGVADVDNHIQVDPNIPRPSDPEIKANVINLLQNLSGLDMDEATVAVNDGHVTLEGSAPTFWTKDRVEKLIALLPGVLEIHNKLAVVPSKDILDESIAQSITQAFERNAGIDTESIFLNVENGVVTLSGIVPTWLARQAAYEIALHTEGVVHINDKLIVKAAS
jgi:osmotically-inducible protein OsmY